MKNNQIRGIIKDLNYVRTGGSDEELRAAEYLRDACTIICDTFKHSPVFRIGGDEFAVVPQGRDYARLEELLWKMHDYNSEASRTGGIMIACGMARYEGDACVASVFDRADQSMYENKKTLKASR